MRGTTQTDISELAHAYLSWWDDAGVDAIIGENPTDWLRLGNALSAHLPNKPVTNVVEPAQNSERNKSKETIESFVHSLEHDDSRPERSWAGKPILPSGDLYSPLMIISDMPDTVDMKSGHLFADRAGKLFDAMLASIGLDRGSIYLTSLFMTRPPGGLIEAADLDIAITRIRRQLTLSKPQKLLLLGDRTSHALLGSTSSREDSLHVFNHDGGNIPTLATLHPRLLLSQPAAKVECWRILQRLVEEQN